MNSNFKIGIIGGGLAGLSLAIQMSKAGLSVVLFEKNEYPFHKLCGEYLSNESVPFLNSLGLDLKELGAVAINEFVMTNPSGRKLEAKLPLGGIGISRYLLDYQLCKLAKASGTFVSENTLVKRYENLGEQKIIYTSKGEFVVDILISAYGKKSNLIKLSNVTKRQTNNYIGIKYHIKLPDYPAERISLHNFNNGYCGISRLEGDWVSLCYLSHTSNLKAAGNKIEDLEKKILFQNSEIKKIFQEAEFLYEKPIAVSNIDFKPKDLIRDGVLFCGDSAGLITPLCGNGMSMALHSSSILSKLITKHINGNLSKKALYSNYKKNWNKQFQTRMAVGRVIQKTFRKEKTADLSFMLLAKFPFLKQQIIRFTHGQIF